MIRLKTINPNHWNRSLILPFIGESTISQSGVIEVKSREAAEALIEAGIGFEFEEEVAPVAEVKSAVDQSAEIKTLEAKVAKLEAEKQALQGKIIELSKPIATVEPAATPDTKLSALASLKKANENKPN
jgi:hypothetical protein